jgi:hypothetical protein
MKRDLVVRKDAHGHWHSDAFDTEERRPPVLPVETAARNPRVRQPRDRDVVENVVAREALKLFDLNDATREVIVAGSTFNQPRSDWPG